MPYGMWLHKGCGGSLEVIVDADEEKDELLVVLLCDKCGWRDIPVRFGFEGDDEDVN